MNTKGYKKFQKAFILSVIFVFFYFPHSQAFQLGNCGSTYAERLGIRDSYGNASFGNSCLRHDACYETCGSSKDQCDSQFHRELRDACGDAYPWQGHIVQKRLCLEAANTYHSAVHRMGGDAYRAAQKRCPQTTNATAEYENAVIAIYRAALDRNPEPGGLRHHVALMQQGWSVEQIRFGIASGQESRNNINNLYRRYLCRDAEPAGMEHHVNLLESGSQTLAQIDNGIRGSAEAQNVRRQGGCNQVRQSSQSSRSQQSSSSSSGYLYYVFCWRRGPECGHVISGYPRKTGHL